ncbi:MAG: hypothetical protein GXP42_06460 [Chloroflexi bacterium]|nr:hypothetical protein [Chloroflexota bacterium]
MFRRDLETFLKSVFVVLGTGILFLTLDPDLIARVQISPVQLLGQTLLIIVFMTYFLSVETLFSSIWRHQLLPQTRLALWILGMMAIFLGTEGWRRSEPTVGYWLLTAALLTWLSRDGWRWLFLGQRRQTS